MWRYLLACAVVASLGCGPALAADLIAYTEEWAPYNFMDGAEVSGIASDILRATCKEARINCSLRLVPWARAYKTALENPNTLVYTTARKPSREKDFVWIGPILPRTTWVYVRSGLDKNIQSIKDLAQYRVGVVRGEAALQDLLDAGVPESALSVQSSNADVLRMLSTSMVDAMVETEVGMAWHLRGASADTSSVTRLMKLSDGGAYYFALNLHSDEELARKLQSALDKLRRDGKTDAIVRQYAARRK